MGPAAIVAAVVLAVHLPLVGRYGFHRDELYYLAGGQRLALGYVDHPPLVPVLARLTHIVFGDHLWPLRTATALVHAAIVVIVAQITLGLGGRRWAAGTAGLAVAGAPVFLGTGAMFQTVIFELLWSAIAMLLVVRLLHGADPRWWLALGAVLGVALETKWTILLVPAALGVGLVVFPETRKHLRTGWLWAGGSIALVLWLPNLAWQVANDWPSLEFARNNNANVQEEAGRVGFVVEQFLLPGPVGAVLAVVGLLWLWRREPEKKVFAVAAGFAFVVLLAIGGKSYYMAPMLLVLWPAGAIAAEGWASERPAGGRQWRIVIVLAVAGLIALPGSVALLPQQTYGDTLLDVNPELGAEVGWPELTDQVAAVYRALPAGEQTDARVLTANYGEAAAIEMYGPARGVPGDAVLSAHNSYVDWWPDGEPTGTVIAVGYGERRLAAHFGSVELAATVSNPWDLENDELGEPIFICRELRTTPDELRDELQHFE